MQLPTQEIDTKSLFGLSNKFSVHAFEAATETVPGIDSNYHFDATVTEAILLGFATGRRVFVHGSHGSGKSTHVEQVAARLNWPCVRVNLDGHISRSDLLGKDTVVLEDGKQITKFKPGILTWAMQNPVALVLDEYDAGRPDVMFVLQRVLEFEGKLTLPEENIVIEPHPAFRIFATANTIGLGDASGQYAGTQPINQAQLDRWHLVTELGHFSKETECAIVLDKVTALATESGRKFVADMVLFADLTRQSFQQGELSTFMSLRNLLTWAENCTYINNTAEAFRLSYLNRCDAPEKALLAEFYQRCFGENLMLHSASEIIY